MIRFSNLLSVSALAVVCFASCSAVAQVVERPRPEGWENLVYGGRFMDRFEPSPIRNELTSDTWGVDAVKPRDISIGIEHPDWSYWGGNVKKLDDTYHLMVCRWPENHPKGHMAWHGSDVVYATAPNLWGPYTPVKEVGPGHNPEVFQAKDGSYVTYVIGGYYHAEQIDGPWTRGQFDFDTRDRRVHQGYSNFTFAPREDGSVLAICRGGGTWISATGLTPFEQVTNDTAYPKVRGNFEDPVIWKTEIQYHMIVNDWSGRIAWYLRSPNGIDWVVDPGEAYLPGVDVYEDGTVVDWYKYERLKVFQDQYGRAIQAFFAVIDYDKRKDGPNDIHSSKNINMPLTVGRRIQVLNTEKLGPTTKTIALKVLAEPDFDPHTDLAVGSLRFGAPQDIDFGGGGKVIDSKREGADRILTFDATGNAFTAENFAGKLLGKTTEGELLFGYSRLPGVTYESAYLSTKLPKASLTSDGLELAFDVKNYGIHASAETEISVRFHGHGIDETFKASVPALEAQEVTTLVLSTDKQVDPELRYQILVTSETQKTALYDSQNNSELSVGVATPDIISVNFGEQQHQIGANSPAGINNVFNWNAANGASGSLNSLVDGSGTATAANVRWNASNCWTDGSAKGSGSAQLQRGYLDDGGNGVSITVENVPFADYQVLVYYSSGANQTDLLPIRIDGQSLQPSEPFKKWGKLPKLGDHNVITSAPMSGASFSIQGMRRDGERRCSISGIQIIQVDPRGANTEALNIVYLLSDNQSFYELSAHGHTGVQTPNLDQLASQGVNFHRFYAPPYCSPSRGVMMTGKYALRSGIHNTIGGRSILHHKDPTIADILREHGYATGIFGKWHLGFTYPHRPSDRGFDEVFVHSGGGIGQLEDYYQNSHYDPTLTHNGQIVHTQGYSTDVLFDQAMNWIEQQGDDPFFCFVSTPAVHTPHHGPKDAQGKNTGLQGMIQNLDENVGRMMAKLDALGLSENTVLVFASDQGMSYRGSPEGWRKTTIAHDAMHHVPFIVRLPGAKPHINTELTGMIDFVPTMLDLLAIDAPHDLDGVSLKPLLLGNKEDYPSDRTLIIQCPRERNARKWQHASVKQGPWRMLKGKQLYNIENDPTMETDIASHHPEVMEQLRGDYETFWNSLPPQKTTLSRHVIGSQKSPETTLNAMDWYRGAQPWTLDAMTALPENRKNQNGAWAITIAEDGNYSFELRRFPREANKPMEVEYAQIQIGDHIATKQFDRDAVSMSFELQLQQGDYDLQTWLDTNADFTLNYGAVFVYVSKH